ncbi:hypothetical protein EDB84DRAFT_1556283 [Lactarius hengduanensis]|nr:hypothetical protein EDB84DRAFT_1556283 [Lactarius hengduanensis]
MAPHTRKSKRLQETQALASEGVNGGHASLGHSGMRTNTVNQVSVGGQDVNVQHANGPTPTQRRLTGKGKRTSTSLNDSPGIPAAVQPTPAKKARNVGPDRGRPMMFHLASEIETVGQSPSRGVAGVSEGAQRAVQLATSSSSRPYVFGSAPRFDPGPRDYDTYPTTEEGSDDSDSDDLADLPQGPPDKIHKAMAAESPSWLDPAISDSRTTPVRKTVSTETLSSDHDTSSANIGSFETTAPAGSSSEQGQATTESSSAWPAETNLVLPLGGTRIKVTQQSDLIRDVIQSAIEDVQFSLLFIDAFPHGILIISFVRQALNIAAQKNCPAALSIQRRLLDDGDYMLRFVPVVRARIPLFRSEVKDRCNTIVLGEFASMAPADIVTAVEWQRSGYKYVYPKGPKVPGANRLVMQSQPYRNRRIIQVIHDLYFVGGSGNASFSIRFDQAFPRYTGDDGVTVREVPIPMVALVSTALYASIIEWRTGVQKVAEFSANAYFGVYQAHVTTLEIIRNQRNNAYHKMMSSIYSQASSAVGGDPLLSSQTTELDLDLLE